MGVSAAIRTIEEDIQYASRSDAKVLITGETGVGKEIVARLIHQRARAPIGRSSPINCAVSPTRCSSPSCSDTSKGSFTGAYRDKPGLLEMAHGGTSSSTKSAR